MVWWLALGPPLINAGRDRIHSGGRLHRRRRTRNHGVEQLGRGDAGLRRQARWRRRGSTATALDLGGWLLNTADNTYAGRGRFDSDANQDVVVASPMGPGADFVAKRDAAVFMAANGRRAWATGC